MNDEFGSIVLGTEYFKVVSGGVIGSSQPVKTNESTISWGEC